MITVTIPVREPNSHVDLDGKRVYPICENVTTAPDGTLILHSPTEKVEGGWDMYLIKFGEFSLHIHSDHNSYIDLNTERFMAGLSETDELEGYLSCDNIISSNDTFIGHCIMLHTCTEGCVIEDSTINYMPGCGVFSRLEDARISHSQLTDVKLSKNATVKSSTIVDSEIKTPGVGPRVEDAEIRNSTIISGNVLDIYGTVILSMGIFAAGFLRTESLRLGGCNVYCDSFNPESKLEFLSIPLPAGTLHVFNSRGQGLYLCEERTQKYLAVEDPKFLEQLRWLLSDIDQHHIEDAVRYVLDSIHSRIKLIEVLDPRSDKFNAPEYTKEE
jgi:hypothetical protein